MFDRSRISIVTTVTTLLAALAVVTTLAGCGRDPEIRQYSVSKQVPDALRSEAEATALLGAMVPEGDQAWFFKLMGPAEAVADEREEFRAWIESLRFEGREPAWDLPERWREEREEAGMRFATITIPTDSRSLEATVIPLPISGPLDEAVAANVNRWRGQVGLDPSEDQWAGAETISVADGRQAFLVALTGTASSGGPPMGMPPMAGGAGGPGGADGPGGAMSEGPPGAPASTAGPPAAPVPGGEAVSSGGSQTTEEPLAYTVPEGWSPGRGGGMRLAAFRAGGEEAPAEITVIRAGGGEEANLRMWLSQIRSDVSDEDVQAALAEAEEIEAMGVSGRLYRLAGDGGKATHVAVLPEEEGMSLFVKMSGDAATVEAEAESFESFVRSLEPAS